MSNNRRNRRTAKGARHTPMGRARARTKLAANVTEEPEWYLDTPDVRLTRIFLIVLLLHAVAFGGIMAFKMVDKASSNTAITISSAREPLESATQEEKQLAAAVPASRPDEIVEDRARPRPPAPLRKDRDAENAYKVQAGDTLPGVAEQLGVSAAALRQANSILSDNELYPGRWLNVPTPEEAKALEASADTGGASKPGDNKAAAESTPSPTDATPATATVYEVQQGDTPWGISRKLGVPFNDLMKLNGIDRPETLQIGQELKIPGR